MFPWLDDTLKNHLLPQVSVNEFIERALLHSAGLTGNVASINGVYPYCPVRLVELGAVLETFGFKPWFGDNSVYMLNPNLAVVDEDGAPPRNRSGDEFYWVGPLGYIRLEGSQDCQIRIVVVGKTQALADAFAKRIYEEAFEPNLLPRIKAKHNAVHVLVKDYGGLTLRAAGSINNPLIRDNYAPAVVDGFEFIVNEFKASDPNGRVVILDGPTGTGKSHLIRSLVTELDNCMFVLVNPEMVTELGKPDLIQVLLRAADKAQPLCLILEDADTVLTKRSKESMTAISAALNLGDGILGQALNIRLILSTNAKIQEVDKALQRPGRLCARVEIADLTPEQASKVATRLSGVETVVRETHSLAELYSKYAPTTRKTREPLRVGSTE